MITKDTFDLIMVRLAALPEQLNDIPLEKHILWSETTKAPETAEDFAMEAVYVICNSGMKHTIARDIFERCRTALEAGEPTSSLARSVAQLKPIYGHHGKTQAIDSIWTDRKQLFRGYMESVDKVEYCATLPYIGDITKYHLAKNFGVDVAKPDVHLQRLAEQHDTTPQALCEQLAGETGLKIRTVDLVLWMGCAMGVIDTRTGELFDA